MIWIMIININIYFKSLITFCLVIIIEKLKIYFCDYNWILYKIFENVNISRLSGSLIRKLGSNYWKWHILNKKHHCLYFYKQWCFNFYLSNGFIVGNRRTSRMAGESVRSIHIRSIPKPIPPVGGIPISSARIKSSSVVLASSSPCARSSPVL